MPICRSFDRAKRRRHHARSRHFPLGTRQKADIVSLSVCKTDDATACRPIGRRSLCVTVPAGSKAQRMEVSSEDGLSTAAAALRRQRGRLAEEAGLDEPRRSAVAKPMEGAAEAGLGASVRHLRRQGQRRLDPVRVRGLPMKPRLQEARHGTVPGHLRRRCHLALRGLLDLKSSAGGGGAVGVLGPPSSRRP